MKKVVDKFIGELAGQLKLKKVLVEVSDSTVNWLASKGYDPVYGARPLARLIQTTIKDVLSEEMLFGRLKKGGTVLIDLKGDDLSFSYSTGVGRTS
jgi:ATP-dependent Clp protease ATP-binding subunit ClpA